MPFELNGKRNSGVTTVRCSGVSENGVYSQAWRVVPVGVRQRAVVRFQSYSEIRNYSFPDKSGLALYLPRLSKDTHFQTKGNPLS
jgi:hypothetical protein